MDRIQYYKVVRKDYYTNLHYYTYLHTDNMYVSARLKTMNCSEARSFIVRGMSILLQKLHMYITFAKDL